MNKKFLFTLLSLFVAASLVLLPVFSQRAGATPPAPDAWYGAWQMGPNLDGTLIGCSANDGFGRVTGVYYEPDNRVYFLGARCENNATTGTVFYFDLTTRTYGVTGTVMPTPVSNYQVVTVPDDGNGNGPGFYIIGGRTDAGGQSNVVQVYYPETNTTATIATDPYPPTGAPSPGGVVYAGSKIYVFGGFDGLVMYGFTYVYDPAAAAGSRWTNLGTSLPTPRSYISTVAIGNLIYAIGGDEFDGASLIPINDTVVLDIDNQAAGWQDAAMADLPQANGDAPAVYVNEGYLGGDDGAIFVVGGFWPSPGPYRWVFRYDIASDTWEDFPQLAVPDPATGRRNQAAVYVNSSPTAGLGDGEPGIWTFGGYDGSGTNAMSESSEFFSINVNDVLVLPEQVEIVSVPGGTATHNFVVLNLSAATDTYNLSYSADVDWDVSLPATVGPVDPDAEAPFAMQVTIPADEPCPATGTFLVGATSQNDPGVADFQEVTVVASCGVGGLVTDATSGEPIENAYVWIQNSVDGLDVYFDAYTDPGGAYIITNLDAGTYYMGASANRHQPSFYPGGWPEDAVVVDLAGNAAVVDFNLVSSRLEYSPGSFEAEVEAGASLEQTLTISNTGTGPLYYFFSLVDDPQPEPPPALAELPVPGLPRVDPLLVSNLESAEDGAADFVVVLNSQADLRAAQAISDWEARGEYVYNTLRDHANLTQKGVRQAVQASAASFHPLYIINAVIVRGGNLALVNNLAARPDVAQIIANRAIAIEKPIQGEPMAPQAIEWNITKVKASNVWTTYNVRGEGIVVAEIDTGTQWDHPALKGKYRGWDGATADHNYNWYDPYGQSPNVPSDVDGHGTHVMGTMIGDDGSTNQIGMAPGAKWIACKGGDNTSGYLLTDELLQCAEWIVAPTDLQGDNPDPTKRPHVVNNSWGGGNGDYWFTGVTDSWRAAGIFPQFSNGNAGPSCSTAGSPGDNWNTFSAGASDINDNIVAFSSRGPSVNFGYLKPDITAPGANIRSSVPSNAYAFYSGTSMASPHVAGAIALLWSSNPELIGQIDLSGWVLQQTAVPKTTLEGCGGDLPDEVPNNTWGWGRLDIFAAVQKARAGGVTPEWLSVSPLGGMVEPGESLPVSLTFSPDVDMYGVYTATLWMVADDPTTNDLRLPVNLTVFANPPVAGFTSSSPVTLGETMVFTNTTTGTQQIDYLWDFGDTITTTLESPTHTYTTTGVYTVTLTASNNAGEDTFTAQVEVLPEPLPPVAGFESNTPQVLGETAIFTNTSTGDGELAFLWDFGDEITSTLESPTHLYTETGTYTVTLTVTSPYGEDTVTQPFEVNEAPIQEYFIYVPLITKDFALE
jgi:PKD repeat protein